MFENDEPSEMSINFIPSINQQKMKIHTFVNTTLNKHINDNIYLSYYWCEELFYTNMLDIQF